MRAEVFILIVLAAWVAYWYLSRAKANRQSTTSKPVPEAVASVFALLMPLSVFWPTGLPASRGALPIFVTPGLYLSDIALAGIIVSIFSVGRVRQLSAPSVSLISYALLALVALGTLVAPAALEPRLAIYGAVRWLAVFLVYLWMIRTNVQLNCLVSWFALGLGLHVAVAQLQIMLQAPVGLPGELTLSLDEFGSAHLVTSSALWLRPYGLTFHPNVLGGYLAIAVILTVPLLTKRTMILLWWLLWLGLFSSFSRSAWLATALGVPVVTIWHVKFRPESRRNLLIAVAGAGLVLALGAWFWPEQLAVRLEPLRGAVMTATEILPGEERSGALSDSQSVPIDERREQMGMALGVIAARPLHGIGANNFSLLAPLGSMQSQPVHNVVLLLAAETGVLGGALWIMLVLLGVRLLLKHFRLGGSWVAAGLSAWLALAVISMFDFYPWGLNAGRLLTGMVLGIVGRGLSQE